MKSIISLSLLLTILLSFTATAQDTLRKDSLRKDALSVYFNCPDCDMDYVKKGITFINYVRDKNDAQLYILVTSMNTGSGGGEYKLFFIGLKEFTGRNDTLTYNTLPTSTEDEKRVMGNQMLKLGLMPYVAKTPLAKNISIAYESNEQIDKVVDPWKSWVFNINGQGYLSGEESHKWQYLYSYIEASKITEKMKLDISASYSFNKNIYKIDSVTNVTTLTNSKSLNVLYVKSLGEHWSAGGTSHIQTSSYSNQKLRYLIAPAIEFDAFKYSESTRRQLRFLYEIGVEHDDYIDTTIYNKISENLFSQTLTVAFKEVETWGSISASLYGDTYFHDFTKNSLGLSASVDIRLFKGLSLSLTGDAYLIHDQLSLPKGGASEQEILTQQKQLASQYSYSTSIGLTYTFGSIYNNVVNPRFGN